MAVSYELNWKYAVCSAQKRRGRHMIGMTARVWIITSQNKNWTGEQCMGFSWLRIAPHAFMSISKKDSSSWAESKLFLALDLKSEYCILNGKIILRLLWVLVRGTLRQCYLGSAICQLLSNYSERLQSAKFLIKDLKLLVLQMFYMRC